MPLTQKETSIGPFPDTAITKIALPGGYTRYHARSNSLALYNHDRSESQTIMLANSDYIALTFQPPFVFVWNDMELIEINLRKE